jgi:hypothetical protein
MSGHLGTAAQRDISALHFGPQADIQNELMYTEERRRLSALNHPFFALVCLVAQIDEA